MKSKLIEEHQGERTFALVLDAGDEVMAGLRAFAKEANLTAARLTAIGAFRDVTLGFFDPDRKEYDKTVLKEQVEVLSLLGNVAVHEGKPAVHAHVVVGSHEGIQSPLPAPAGINYLLVTLPLGESWTYRPPTDHSVGWLALAKGALDAGEPIDAGEMVIFENGSLPIVLEATDSDNAVFVLGSAVPHPYPLYLGHYSVHTSAQALETGERRIAELGRRMKEAGNRNTALGTIPVYR